MEAKNPGKKLYGVVELGRYLMDSKKEEQREMREEFKSNPAIRAAIEKLKKRNEQRGTAKINL